MLNGWISDDLTHIIGRITMIITLALVISTGGILYVANIMK